MKKNFLILITTLLISQISSKALDETILFQSYGYTSESTQIHLNGQGIDSISINTFSLTNNVEVLHLENNKLTRLENGLFKGLSKLRELWLESNQIVTIDKDAFVGLNNLETVCLYGNPISSFFPNLVVSLCSTNPKCNIKINEKCQRTSINDKYKYFVNSAVLSAPDQYVIYWNYTENDITFKAVVKTSGWIGFGLSPNGGMKYSDLIVAYFNSDGSTNFTDRHVEGTNSRPIKDQIQNWRLLQMSQENGFISVIFTRKLKIPCNNLTNEVNIDIVGTQYAIFAWGSLVNGDIAYHSTNRGSTSLQLTTSLNQNINLNMSDIETIDFRLNASLTNYSPTEYFCQMFQLPADWVKTKRHLVRFETLIQPGNEKFLHHWLFYECSVEWETIQTNYNFYPQPKNCFKIDQFQDDTYWPTVENFCRKISLSWAVGGALVQDFPENLGYPLGGSESEFKYFYLQVHYDNPRKILNVKDNSGIRLYVTKKYRPIEFGVLTVGADVPQTLYHTILIPPKANKMKFDFYCIKDCSNNLFEDGQDNVTIFAILPHSHYAGRSMVTTVIRNGTEIEYLANEKYYDFNYQYLNFMQKPFIYKRDDEMRVTCSYNTPDRTDNTAEGLTTYDEMCFNFVWYYPRNRKISQCLQTTMDYVWKRFLYANNYEQNDNGMIKFLDWLKTENITKSQKLIENFYNSAPRTELIMLNIFGKDVVQFKDFQKPDFVPLNNEECTNVPRKLEDAQKFNKHKH